MRALVRTMLLLLVGLFLLVNLMARLGGRVGPAETVVLAAMAVLLIWAAVRLRRRPG